jgi:hypothetical protein
LPSSRVFVTVKVESRNRSSRVCSVAMQAARLARDLPLLDVCEKMEIARRSVFRVVDILGAPFGGCILSARPLPSPL